MRLTREFFIPKGAIKVSDRNSDAVAYLTTSKNGKPCASIFFGKQTRPVANYTYRDAVERERSVRDYFERARIAAKNRADAQQERKDFAHGIRVGDIFTTCWGYDQTNREAFEVVEVRGKHAILREIAMASETKGSSDRVVPQSGAFLSPRYDGDDQGIPIRRLIQRGYNGEARIKIDKCRSGSPWGKRDPITGTIIGRSMERTASGWGH